MVQTDTSTSTNVSLVETYISACLFSINRSGKCSKYFKFKNNFVKLFQLQANSNKLGNISISPPAVPMFCTQWTNIWSVSVVDVIFHIDKLIYCSLSFVCMAWAKHVLWKRNDGKYWDKYVKWNAVEREIIMLYEDKLQSLGHASFRGKRTWKEGFEISDYSANVLR